MKFDRVLIRSHFAAAAFNLLLALVFFFWERLFYWCQEGNIPLWAIGLSLLTLVALWLIGNGLFIRKKRMPPFQLLLTVGAVWIAMYLIKPLYYDFINNVAMITSFRILDFFHKG